MKHHTFPVRPTPPRRRVLLLGLPAALLAGCGFEPVYGDRTVTNPAPGKPQTVRVSDELSAIWVEPIPNRVGQMMRNALIDRINGTYEPSQPRYRLEVRLQELKQALLERRDTLETATNLILIASYRLKAPDGSALATNKSRTVVLYNQLTSPYATIAAEDFARERAVQLTAEDIRLRLSLFIANRLGT